MMKINYKSSFVAIILTFVLFVGFSFSTGSKHTAYANTKSTTWVKGVPKALQGKSYYDVKDPLKSPRVTINGVYFGKKEIFLSNMVYRKIDVEKGKYVSDAGGNSAFEKFKYQKSGNNYTIVPISKYYTKGRLTFKIKGTKVISFITLSRDKIRLTQNKLNMGQFYKHLGIPLKLNK